MLKLKQLQEAKKKAAAAAGTPTTDPSAEKKEGETNGADASAAATTTAATGTAASTTTTTTTTNADADGEDGAGETGDKKENVFTLKGKAGGKKGKTRANAAQLRAQKDITEMDPIPGCVMSFPDPNNMMEFKVDITPSEGLYGLAKFNFTITVPNTYPYDPPKVQCNTLVYHPNIDWEGKVCLNILREDWMPVLNLGSVIYGLLTLFLDPNPDDPLNKDAANEMVQRLADFKSNVARSLRGGTVLGRSFPKLLAK